LEVVHCLPGGSTDTVARHVSIDQISNYLSFKLSQRSFLSGCFLIAQLNNVFVLICCCSFLSCCELAVDFRFVEKVKSKYGYVKPKKKTETENWYPDTRKTKKGRNDDN